MKKIAALFVAATVAISVTTPAQADWGRHGYGGYGGFRPPMHHHHGGPGWVGPAAVLAITGLALGAAAYSRAAPPPAPVYTAPPPNAGVWYYCGSSGQYYPYTNACPEGWQAVPAR